MCSHLSVVVISLGGGGGVGVDGCGGASGNILFLDNLPRKAGRLHLATSSELRLVLTGGTLATVLP